MILKQPIFNAVLMVRAYVRSKDLLTTVQPKMLIMWLIASPVMSQTTISMAASLSQEQITNSHSHLASSNEATKERQGSAKIDQRPLFGHIMVATKDARLWRGSQLPRSVTDNQTLAISDRLESPSGGLAVQALDKSLILFGAGGLVELQAMTFDWVNGGHIRIALKGGSFRVIHGLITETGTKKAPVCALRYDTGEIKILSALDISIDISSNEIKTLDCRFGHILAKESPEVALARLTSTLDGELSSFPQVSLGKNKTPQPPSHKSRHSLSSKGSRIHTWELPRKLLAIRKQAVYQPPLIASAPKMDHFPEPEIPDYSSVITQSQTGLRFISMKQSLSPPLSLALPKQKPVQSVSNDLSNQSPNSPALPSSWQRREAQPIGRPMRIFRRLASP